MSCFLRFFSCISLFFHLLCCGEDPENTPERQTNLESQEVNFKIKGEAPVNLTASEMPWLGYFKYQVENPLVLCSGFSLKKGVIITAAHCVMKQRGENSYAREFSLNKMVWSRQILADTRPENHSKAIRAYVTDEAAAKSYAEWSNEDNFADFARFDIAIVAVESLNDPEFPYSFGPAENYDYKTATIAGYGLNNSGSNGRKIGGKTVIAPGAGPGYYIWKPMGNEWQTVGDSGSPVIVKINDNLFYTPTLNAVGTTEEYSSRINRGPDLASNLAWIKAAIAKADDLLSLTTQIGYLDISRN